MPAFTLIIRQPRADDFTLCLLTTAVAVLVNIYVFYFINQYTLAAVVIIYVHRKFLNTVAVLGGVGWQVKATLEANPTQAVVTITNARLQSQDRRDSYS